LNDLEKLDVIIVLLTTIITWGAIRFIIGVFVRRFSGESRVRVIQALLGNGNFEMALHSCKKYLEKRPNDPDLLWYRAVLYFKLERNIEAKEEFEKIAHNEPLYKEDALKYLDILGQKT